MEKLVHWILLERDTKYDKEEEPGVEETEKLILLRQLAEGIELKIQKLICLIYLLQYRFPGVA